MKKRDIALLATALIVVVGAIIFFTRQRKPIQYQGKDAWEWALALQSPITGAKEAGTIALGAMGTNAVPRLVEQLEYQESFTRKSRLWLGKKLPGQLGTTVTRGLKPVFIGDIHWVAARALQVLGTNAATATPALLRALRTDPEAQVTWDSATTLGVIGAPAVPGLIELLKEPNQRVRHAAAYALGQVGAPALPAAPALIRSAADPNGEVRGSSLYSLSRIGPAAGPVALKVVQENRGELRRAGALALVALHPRGQLTLPVLVEMFRDPDPASRAIAIEALMKLTVTHTNAMDVYFAGLKDTNAAVRLAAVNSLGQAAHKSAAAIPTLTSLQRDDPDEAIRIAAGDALEKISAASATKTSP
ncbi:MAG: HEAT repeat domain-containing protein [Pedosphaera sp.]|nr:HEAT repeat domain-containing protein [Pedosphaera sp.]